MADHSIERAQPVFHVAFRQHAVTAMLILGFIAAGWLRLNDCDLLNPDSPRYLIYAQSLADTGQYRAIDTPGAPLYTWRPPGLPILLAPVLWLRPYDVVAAKCVVLLTAALLLLVVHAIASTTRGGWSGPMTVAIVAVSPMFLSLSTEVLTEIPYALGTLVVLYGIARWEGEAPAEPQFTNDVNLPRGSAGASPSHKTSSGWALALILVALAFTPIIRTVGVALVVAVGLWSVTARRRWRVLPAVALAIAGLAWLAWRSRHAPQGNYAGSLLHSIQEHGLLAAISNAWQTVVYYASAFPGVLLPGLTREQPFYAHMTVGTLPALAGFEIPVIALTGLLLTTSVCGLWSHRHNAGLVGLMYVVLYAACLAIWPWRHERFLWPLVPLVWAYFPAGCQTLGARLPKSFRATLQPVLCLGLLALCGWQLLADGMLISSNRQFLADRDSFYQDQAPGFYFSDWRRAGTWIRDNTPGHSRLLTWQAAVGGTAHRFQRRVQFEAMSPEKIRQQIAAFPARYLVVTNAQFGLGFGRQQLFADPAYLLTTVYSDRDVSVLEVSPNRGGKVSRDGYSEWLAAQSSALDSVLARHPDRLDLLARKADLLQESGQSKQAMVILEKLIDRGVVTVRICSSLGWLYFSEGKYEQAARYLDLARGLPNAEPVAESLADGARRARERQAEGHDESLDKALKRSLNRIRNQVGALSFNAAERELEAILPRAPENSDLNYWRGYLHHLFGELDQAEACYVKSIDALPADPNSSTSDLLSRAKARLLVLRMERAMGQSAATVVQVAGMDEQVDPDNVASHVRLAKLYDENGWSGRSVALLEAARQRFGDRPEVLAPLADLYFRFARPEEAIPLYRIALESSPGDKSLQQGLAMAEAAMRQWTMAN